MSRFKYRFTLHQIYAHYARTGTLKWRDLAKVGRVSSRTLSKYFENTQMLEKELCEYHLKNLEHIYSHSNTGSKNKNDFQFRRVWAFVKRHRIVYQFTDQAFKNNLDERGKEIKTAHFEMIRKAMLKGGVEEDRADPELAFNFFLTELPNNEKGQAMFFHFMKFFAKPTQEVVS